jgi:hypothetical protein
MKERKELIENHILLSNSMVFGMVNLPLNLSTTFNEYGLKEIKQSDLLLKTDSKGKKVEYVLSDGGKYPFSYVDNCFKIIKFFEAQNDFIILYAKDFPLIILPFPDNVRSEEQEKKGVIAGFVIAPKISSD